MFLPLLAGFWRTVNPCWWLQYSQHYVRFCQGKDKHHRSTKITGFKNYFILLQFLCWSSCAFAFSEEWSDFFYGYLLRLPALLLISISRWLLETSPWIDDLRRDWNYQRNHSCPESRSDESGRCDPCYLICSHGHQQILRALLQSIHFQ